VVEGYNPRIHALYFCPQLFRHDSEPVSKVMRRGDPPHEQHDGCGVKEGAC
jgi:hypothetical protein